MGGFDFEFGVQRCATGVHCGGFRGRRQVCSPSLKRNMLHSNNRSKFSPPISSDRYIRRVTRTVIFFSPIYSSEPHGFLPLLLLRHHSSIPNHSRQFPQTWFFSLIGVDPISLHFLSSIIFTSEELSAWRNTGLRLTIRRCFLELRFCSPSQVQPREPDRVGAVGRDHHGRSQSESNRCVVSKSRA